MWEEAGRWHGRLERPAGKTVSAKTREGCLSSLRRAAGRKTLTVEVTPALAGVAEAAEIMGWDKRRVITYINRNAFPEPFASLASGRVWRREDVEAFAKAWHARHAKKRRS